MILIDEIHRCGSLGTGQGLQGGLTIGLPPVVHFGSEELQNRVIPEVLSGKKRICLAITEPEVSSSALDRWITINYPHCPLYRGAAMPLRGRAES